MANAQRSEAQALECLRYVEKEERDRQAQQQATLGMLQTMLAQEQQKSAELQRVAQDEFNNHKATREQLA